MTTAILIGPPARGGNPAARWELWFSVVSANLQRATRLRQSILQKAFTGELAGGANSPQSKGQRP